MRAVDDEGCLSGMDLLAFEAGTYSFAMKPKAGPAIDDKGKYVIVLRRDGAAWKISHDIFNSDLPPPPPAK